MSIVINANNFPTFFAPGAVNEELFLKPDGSRVRYPIGWLGKGRYTAGSLRIWCNGERLVPGTDYTEEPNGVFYNFAAAPAASKKIDDYIVSYVPRAADLAKTTARDLFMFPNWKGGAGIGDAFFIGKNLASHLNATPSSVGSDARAQSKAGVVPWCSLTRDSARVACIAAGGHLTRNREYGNIIHWCRHHDIYPSGNSVSGVDGMGVAGSADPTQAGRTLAGSGPVTWNHNGREGGIRDIVGNCWEYVDGVELRSGVFWIANANNILENSGVSLSITATSGTANFSHIVNASEALLLECLPAVSGQAVKGGDGCWYNKTDDKLLRRFGFWRSGALDGLFTFGVDESVAYAGDVNFGFRLAFSLDEFEALSS